MCLSQFIHTRSRYIFLAPPIEHLFSISWERVDRLAGMVRNKPTAGFNQVNWKPTLNMKVSKGNCYGTDI